MRLEDDVSTYGSDPYLPARPRPQIDNDFPGPCETALRGIKMVFELCLMLIGLAVMAVAWLGIKSTMTHKRCMCYKPEETGHLWRCSERRRDKVLATGLTKFQRNAHRNLCYKTIADLERDCLGEIYSDWLGNGSTNVDGSPLRMDDFVGSSTKCFRRDCRAHYPRI